MMKLCGAIIIMGTGFTLGCLPLMAMKERIRALEGYREELMRMRAELSTYGMSIPELIHVLRNSVLFSLPLLRIEEEGPMAFSVGWKTGVAQNSGSLTVHEKNALERLGDVLGRYSIEEQLCAIDEVVDIFEQGKAETLHKLRSVTRLYMGTSLSLSAMLVVLLL